MKRTVFSVLFTFVFIFVPAFAEPVRHWDLQEVDQDGFFVHPAVTSPNPITIEGVILNRPSYMLDPTPDESAPDVGAQWQVYIQGEPNDHAGTAVWMGQRYTAVGGSGVYSDQEWSSEIFRITHDLNTGYDLQPGDKVKVTGLCKFYKGKVNLNERHTTNPDYDFTIELVESNLGLPLPETITLDMVKDQYDEFIFDPNRGCDEDGVRIQEVPPGCEYYQGRLVRINDVSFVALDWQPDGTATIEDSTGRTFPVLFGRGPGFSEPDDLPTVFDIIGIFDQEASGYTICKDGYRIWVTNYDGNGQVLTDFGVYKNHLEGDIDMDGDVDMVDFARLAANWLLFKEEGS